MSKFDINEAFIQALQEQEMLEARSHAEINNKVAPRDVATKNGMTYMNKYNSENWSSNDIKRNRVSSKERAQLAKQKAEMGADGSMSDVEWESNWKKKNDMRYEPSEYDLNKRSREYKDSKLLNLNNKKAEARSHAEINNKVAPRDRSQSFEGGVNGLSNYASGLVTGDKDSLNGLGTVKVGDEKGTIFSRDIKRNRVRSAKQALNRRNAGALDFAGKDDMQNYEKPVNPKTNAWKEEHDKLVIENDKKEEFLDISASINTGDIDLGGLGSLAGLFASEEVKEDEDKLEEELGTVKDSYWEGKGKYKDLIDLINAKLLPSEGTNAKVEGIIPENLFKKFVTLQNKYYRFYNDGELPFRKTSAGWNVTKSSLEHDMKNQFNHNIDKPVLHQISVDLEDKMNKLVEEILAVVPDLEEKLNNIGKEEKTEDVEYISKKELDDMPSDYKSTVKDTIDTEVNYRGADRKKITQMYKDLGYDEEDPMILALDDKNGTVLKPVKVKTEGVEVKSNDTTMEVTDLHTDLFSIIGKGVNMNQYQVADDIICTRDELDEIMREVAEPDIQERISYALPSAKVSFGEFDHPKYYRAFSNLNDVLFFNVTCNRAEYEKLKEDALNDEEGFNSYLANNFSSYDGFISFMADNIEDFKTQEEWKQFVQVISYAMPEYTTSDYNDFLTDVVDKLYSSGYETESMVIENATEEMPEDVTDVEGWIRQNFNIPELYDLDWIVDEVKRNLEDRKTEGKSIKTNKSIKTEDIDNEEIEDEEENDEDAYGETISLMSIAYRDIPKIGVEDWGKDDELNFCADTKELLTYLDEYEVEIPKKLYEDAPSDDWSNGVNEYLESWLGINPNDGESSNTYNWSANLTHDAQFTEYKTNNGLYVKMSIHRDGDVRGNYTVDFLLRFDEDYEFYEVIDDICRSELSHTVTVDEEQYVISASFWSNNVDIYRTSDGESWDDVYCNSIEELKAVVSGKVEESKLLEKKYGEAEYHTYNVDGHEFVFACRYFETSARYGSSWGHEVDLRMDGNTISNNKTNYYNRTWESFKYQTCMLGAVRKYRDALESNLINKAKQDNNKRTMKQNEKDELLNNNEWYKMIQELYNTIANGDSGEVE